MNAFEDFYEDGSSNQKMYKYEDFNSGLDEDGLSIEENTNLASLSPYLNFDPTYLPTQPEYIFPYGAKRGRFEYSFYYIGASCMVGAAVGGFRGFYNGLNLTTLAGQTGRVRRTRILNHIMKQGAATANTLGSIALMYSGLGVILTSIRSVDDELNCLCAATLTGAFARLPGSLYKCAVGGAVGLGLASLYCLYTVRDKFYLLEEKFNTRFSRSNKETITDYYDE